MPYTVTLPDGRTVSVPDEMPPERARDILVAKFPELFPKPETSVAGNVKEAFKGVIPGAAGMVGTAIKGAASLLPDEYEQSVNQATSEAVQGLSKPFEAAPGYEDSIGRKFGEGLGSTAPFFALGPLGLAGRIGAAGLGVAAGAGEARGRAEAAGATPGQRALSTLGGAAVGSTEVLPVLGFLHRIGKPAEKAIFEYIKRAAIQGGEEAVQEAGAQIAQNAIARGLYDPNQALLEGSGEAGAYGGGVGIFIQALTDLALGRRAHVAAKTKPGDKTPIDKAYDELEAEVAAKKADIPEPVVKAPTKQLELPLEVKPSYFEDRLVEFGFPKKIKGVWQYKDAELDNTEKLLEAQQHILGKIDSKHVGPEMREKYVALLERIQSDLAAKEAADKQLNLDFYTEPTEPKPEVIPTGEVTEAVPTGEATEIEDIPAGEVVPEPIPVGETTDVPPTGDATEIEPIPTGEATGVDYISAREPTKIGGTPVTEILPTFEEYIAALKEQRMAFVNEQNALKTKGGARPAKKTKAGAKYDELQTKIDEVDDKLEEHVPQFRSKTEPPVRADLDPRTERKLRIQLQKELDALQELTDQAEALQIRAEIASETGDTKRAEITQAASDAFYAQAADTATELDSLYFKLFDRGLADFQAVVGESYINRLRETGELPPVDENNVMRPDKQKKKLTNQEKGSYPYNFTDVHKLEEELMEQGTWDHPAVKAWRNKWHKKGKRTQYANNPAALRELQDAVNQEGPYLDPSKPLYNNPTGFTPTKTAKSTHEEILNNQTFAAGQKRLEIAGISHAANWVSDWHVVVDTIDKVFGGLYRAMGSRQHVTLSLPSEVNPPAHVVHTYVHEVGHAVDLAGYGGVYSRHSAMPNIITELKSITDPYLKKIFEHPFSTEGLSEANLNAEVFAQLFSLNASPNLRETLREQAPLSFNYIEAVYEDVKKTNPRQTHTRAIAEARAIKFEENYQTTPTASNEGIREYGPGSTGFEGRTALGNIDRKPSPLWRSALIEQAENAPIKKAASPSWKAWLKSLLSKGVKQDEITWSGIVEWLDLNKSNITREDVLKYLDENAVQLEDIVKGEPRLTVEEAFKLLAPEKQKKLAELDEAYRRGFISRGTYAYDQYLDLKQEVKDIALKGRLPTNYGTYVLPGGTKYREILIRFPKGPGFVGHWPEDNIVVHIRTTDRVGKNDERVLFIEEIQSDWAQIGRKKGFIELWSPEEKRNFQEKRRLEDKLESLISRYNRLIQPAYRRNLTLADKQNNQPRIDTYVKELDDNSKRYHLAKQHFEYNLAHYYNTFDITAHRIAQDYHNLMANLIDAREEILRNLVDSTISNEAYIRHKTQFGEPSIGRRLFPEEEYEAQQLIYDIKNAKIKLDNLPAIKRHSVPVGPYVDSTEKWVTLALKRVISAATHGGYDQVVFANGESVAKNMGKMLADKFPEIIIYRNDSLEASKNIDEASRLFNPLWDLGEDTSSYIIQPIGADGTIVNPQHSDASDLSDHVGKDMAEIAMKYLLQHPDEDAVVFNASDSGSDGFQVGGHGLQNFYGSIIPLTLNKLLPKLGSKISDLSLKVPLSTFKGLTDKQRKLVPLDGIGFKVTSEMLDKTGQGMPLFNRNQLQPPTEGSSFANLIGEKEQRSIAKDTAKVLGPRPVLGARAQLTDSLAPLETTFVDLYNGAVRSARGIINPIIKLSRALDSGRISLAVAKVGGLFKQNGLFTAGELIDAERGNRKVSYVRVLSEITERARANNQTVKAARNEVGNVLAGERLWQIRERNEQLEQEAQNLEAQGNRRGAEKARDQKKYIPVQLYQEIDAMHGQFQNDAQIREWAKDLDFIRKNLLDAAVQARRFSAEEARDLADAIGYIPFNRLADWGDIYSGRTGGSNRGSAALKSLKHFEGSDKLVENPLDAYQGLIDWLTRDTMRTDAALSALEDMEVAGLAQRIHTPDQIDADKRDNIVRIPNGRPTQEGKTEFSLYFVPDPQHLYAFTVRDPATNAGIRFLQRGAQWLRAGVTSAPPFALKQVADDIVRSYVYSGVENPGQLVRRILTSFPKVLWDEVRGKKDILAKELENLGIVGTFDIHSSDNLRNVLLESGMDKRGTAETILHYLEMGAKASDIAVRRAIYEQTLQETGDQILAESRAREIINFSRRGASNTMATLTKIIPFTNAYARGMDKLLVAATGGKGGVGMSLPLARSMFWKRMMVMSAMGLAYALIMQDDEDYAALPDYVRDTNWILPYGKYLGFTPSIPIPSELAYIFKAIPERVVRYYKEQGTPKERDALYVLGELMKRGADVFSGPGTVPTAIRPLLENLVNYSFFLGRPLESQAQQNYAPFTRTSTNTSDLSKDIAVGLEGVKNSTGLPVDVSPIMIDNVIRGIGGTMSGIMLSVYDALVNPTRTDRPLYRQLAPQLSGASAFMKDKVGTRYVDDLFDIDNKVTEVHNTYSKLQKDNKYAEAQAYYRKNYVYLQAYDHVHNIKNYYDDLRRQAESIDKNTQYTPSQRRELIDRIKEAQNAVGREISALKYQLRRRQLGFD